MSIYIDVPHAYFEMARAIFNVLNVEMKRWEAEPPDVKKEKMANILFSLISTIIIQCYMTIEAFINEELKELWNESRILENGKSKYPEFYEKYGRYANSEGLSMNTDLSNLGDRINIICKTNNIEPIHKSNNKTWLFFKRMEKVYRHYLIHIYPNNAKFNELINEILLKNELGKYFNTVNNIISHFYIQKDSNPPEWLKDNTLYNFSGIDYL